MPAERRRTKDVDSSASSFEELLLPQPILKGLTAAGFHKPSPVQQAAIPLARAGTDLLIQAKSGTGKTVVFGVVCVESINTHNGLPQALVLAPTREIALQTADVITTLARFMPAPGLKVGVFIGGLPVEDDQKALRRTCHIVVGTPGRVCALLDGRGLHSQHVCLLVLDEADQLMSDSFREDVLWAHSVLPSHKQVLAVSATYTQALLQQLEGLMRAPQCVMLASETTSLLGVRQFYGLLKGHEVDSQGLLGAKMAALLRFLGSVVFHQAVVFCNSKSDAEALADQLTQASFPAAFISGEKSQIDRMDTIAAVRDFRVRVIVSTDLVARGLDLERVNVVANLDLPPDAATYMHRVGRTGRFGTHGLAVTFVTGGELRRLHSFLHEVAGGQVEPLPSYIPEEDYAYALPESEGERAVVKPLSSSKAASGLSELTPPSPPPLPNVTSPKFGSEVSERARPSAPGGSHTNGAAMRGNGVHAHPLAGSKILGDSNEDSTGTQLSRDEIVGSEEDESAGQGLGKPTLEAVAVISAKYPKISSPEKWWVGNLSGGESNYENPVAGEQPPQWLAGIVQDHSLPAAGEIRGNDHTAQQAGILQDHSSPAAGEISGNDYMAQQAEAGRGRKVACSAARVPVDAAGAAESESADRGTLSGAGRNLPETRQSMSEAAVDAESPHSAAGKYRLSLSERLGLSEGPGKMVRIRVKEDPSAAWAEGGAEEDNRADGLRDDKLEEEILKKLAECNAGDSIADDGVLDVGQDRTGEGGSGVEGEPGVAQAAYDAMDEAEQQAAWDAWYWQQSQGAHGVLQSRANPLSEDASALLRQWNAWYSQYMGQPVADAGRSDQSLGQMRTHHQPQQQSLLREHIPASSMHEQTQNLNPTAPAGEAHVQVPIELLARYYELEMQAFARNYDEWLKAYQDWRDR